MSVAEINISTNRDVTQSFK